MKIKLSRVADDETVSQMMFDHADLERSKFYFKMLQILRIINSGLDDLKFSMSNTPLFWFDTLTHRFMDVYCSKNDIDAAQLYWYRLVGMVHQNFASLEQRTQAKKAEVESLQAGVSVTMSSIVMCYTMLTRMIFSCSTQPQFVKHCKLVARIRTF